MCWFLDFRALPLDVCTKMLKCVCFKSQAVHVIDYRGYGVFTLEAMLAKQR